MFVNSLNRGINQITYAARLRAFFSPEFYIGQYWAIESNFLTYKTTR